MKTDRTKYRFADKDERILFSHIFDIADRTIFTGEESFSEFLNPQSLSDCLNIFRNEKNVNVKVFGGFEESERKIAGFYTSHEPQNEDFKIHPLEISYNGKYEKNLGHRDFLGSLLSLGIDRKFVGDILIYENKAVVFVKEEVSDYIIANLEKVKNTSVKIKYLDDFFIPVIDVTKKRISVPSLRLDSVLSEGFNLSRKQATEFISKEKVFVNWICVSSNSKNVKVDDIITLRGKGRMKIIDEAGTSKKGKIVLEISTT